jgi:hypothetical protein
MPQTAPHLMRRIFFGGSADDLTFTAVSISRQKSSSTIQHRTAPEGAKEDPPGRNPGGFVFPFISLSSIATKHMP